MQVNKKNILIGLLFLYVLFSFMYIAYNLFSTFKNRYITQSFEEGQRATIESLISEAVKPECQPFSVYNETQTVNLINTSCLQKIADKDKTTGSLSTDMSIKKEENK